MSATVEEWLLAGEYLLEHGAAGVIYCERGIRGFDHATRNLLDLGAVALLAHVHHLPVVVDPSHATGRRDLVLPLDLLPGQWRWLLPADLALLRAPGATG